MLLLQEIKDDLDKSIESLEKHRKSLLAELQEGKERRSATSSEPEKKTLSQLVDIKDNVYTSAPIQSKFLSAGTPVSIRHSSYAKLPNHGSFATNMGDMELFENLPNSTGAFQKVKSLLDKMKKSVTKPTDPALLSKSQDE